jgi:hypothetical protein
MFKTSQNGSLKKPSYSFAHWFFGRCLGLVTLTAFLSYWSQADALIGTDGISPWQLDLERIEVFIELNDVERSKFSIRPTLLWFSSFAEPSLTLFFGNHLIPCPCIRVYAQNSCPTFLVFLSFS